MSKRENIMHRAFDYKEPSPTLEQMVENLTGPAAPTEAPKVQPLLKEGEQWCYPGTQGCASPTLCLEAKECIYRKTESIRKRAAPKAEIAGKPEPGCQCGDGGCIECWPSNFTSEAISEEIAELRAERDALEVALRGVKALFANSSPFYIKKLGAPITNGDQERIDRTFIALDKALAALSPGAAPEPSPYLPDDLRNKAGFIGGAAQPPKEPQT